MSNIIELRTEDGTSIYIEEAHIDRTQVGKYAGKDEDTSPRISKFRDVFSKVTPIASEIAESLSKLDLAPQEFEVSFAIKFSGKCWEP